MIGMAPLQPVMRALYSRELHHGHKQISLFAVAIPFIAITIVVVFLRIYVRLRLVKLAMAADDYLMVVGAIVAIMLSVAIMLGGLYGIGMHTIDIPPDDIVRLLQANFAVRLLFIVASCLVKCSILVFYRRLDPRRRTRWIVYFLLAWVIIMSVVTFMILLLSCTPPSLFWDRVEQAKHPEKCLSAATQQSLFEIHGMIILVQDAAIYAVPLYIVFNLQMPRVQKIAAAALLCVGLLSVVAGGIRLYYVLFLSKENDTFYYMADSLNWCSIEVYVAIICSCASTFKVLFTMYVPRMWSSIGRSNGPSIERTPRNQSNRSHHHPISMRPFSSNETNSNYNHVTEGLADIVNESQEAIVKKE